MVSIYQLQAISCITGSYMIMKYYVYEAWTSYDMENIWSFLVRHIYHIFGTIVPDLFIQ